MKSSYVPHADRGLVEGTYLHGLFANDAYRRTWLEHIGAGTASSLQYEAAVDVALDAVASRTTTTSTRSRTAYAGAASRAGSRSPLLSGGVFRASARCST